MQLKYYQTYFVIPESLYQCKMRYQKEFDEIDRLCEDVSSKVKDLNKVLSVQAFINEEKNENNDLTQLGIKLSNLYALSKQQAKINKLCQELKHKI